LHDPALVERLEPSDRAELAAVVLSAVEAMSQSAASGSLRRVADLVEFLGLLEADLSEGQIDHLQAAIATVLESGLDAFDLTNLAIAAVRGELDVPPDFYVDLFAMIVNAAPTPPMGLSWLLNEFPAVERSQLVAAELQDFFTLSDPADVASRVPVLRIMSAWIAPGEQRRVRELLIAALDNTQDMSVVPSLATALANPNFRPFQSSSEHLAVKHAIFRKIAATTERSDLAALFDATRTLSLTGMVDADDKRILRAATARFLEQIVSPDGRDASVRGVIKRFGLSLLPSEVEQLSGRFIQTLGDESNYGPIANYAGSIQILSLQAKSGDLGSLLQALHAKLTSTTDAASYPLLLSTWLAVETSTNRDLLPEQRVPLYDELLRLPLMNTERRNLLQERIDELASR
jgi:hypothetical protein